MQLSAHPTNSAVAPTPTTDRPASLLKRLFGNDGLSFSDLIDLVNPLQHIPVVGNLYRKLTQDTIDPAVRVAGGALFGGPLGALFATGGMLLEHGAADTVDAPSAPNTVETVADGGGAPGSAAAAVAEAPRGGWLVSAAVTGRIEAFAPPRAGTVDADTPALAVTVPPPRHPGGWLVEQAYAGSAVARARQPPVHETA